MMQAENSRLIIDAIIHKLNNINLKQEEIYTADGTSATNLRVLRMNLKIKWRIDILKSVNPNWYYLLCLQNETFLSVCIITQCN